MRLPSEEEVKVGRDVLRFLKRPFPDSKTTVESTHDEGGFRLPVLTIQSTMFSSYIDDIAHGAPTWDQLCEDLNALLFRLLYWNVSVSLPPEERIHLRRRDQSYTEDFQERSGTTVTIDFEVVQSFLGSMNYFNKFIEGLPVWRG
ncbi:reverse transcriptase [Phytophthora megakarya]|uniref:Reverse transcriptase n=1 Tax=Phytophthora megakarya TaxID=4795 RepID=A0A225VSZ0_9STRA|nr:reverse transcriptase [Phytophthora megakarya]